MVDIFVLGKEFRSLLKRPANIASPWKRALPESSVGQKWPYSSWLVGLLVFLSGDSDFTVLLLLLVLLAVLFLTLGVTSSCRS